MSLIADPDDEWEWEVELKHNPAWREQLVAMLDRTPIGFVQIIDPFLEETHYWGKVAPNLRAIDIWIGEEKHLNKGYGTAMMHLAIERCFLETAVKGILIDPLKTNIQAHRFYKRLGFRFIEERKFDTSACYVYYLSKSDWIKTL